MENRISKNEKLKKGMKKDETLCLSCSELIPKGGLKEHSKTKKHKENVEKIVTEKRKRSRYTMSGELKSTGKFETDSFLNQLDKELNENTKRLSDIKAKEAKENLEKMGLYDRLKKIKVKRIYYEGGKKVAVSKNKSESLKESVNKLKHGKPKESGKSIKSTKVLAKRKPKKAIINKVRKDKKNPVGQKNSKKRKGAK